MMDMRGDMFNDRTYLTSFINGNQYCTVMHRNVPFNEVLQAVENFHGNLRRPFIVVSSTFISPDTVDKLVESNTIDINMLED